jgi:hypothetical protein
MRTATRLKAAAAAAGLFVAGAVAGGLALRPGSRVPVPTASAPKVQVIHKRRVRTIHLKAPQRASANAAAAPPATAAPTTTQAPAPVTSRTSPGAGGGAGGGDDRAEVERDD